jgi:hypothetical protein
MNVGFHIATNPPLKIPIISPLIPNIVGTISTADPSAFVINLPGILGVVDDKWDVHQLPEGRTPCLAKPVGCSHLTVI